MNDVRPIEDRFWSKVDMSGGCWNWKALRSNRGYGQFNVAGHMCKAHRVAWELLVGPIPPGLLVCHKCDNPSCVNPSHLFLGTQQDNMRDKMAKGRHVPAGQRGEGHHRAKITEVDVVNIRAMSATGSTQADIASVYGLSQSTVSNIVTRKRWRHVSDRNKQAIAELEAQEGNTEVH